jgi:hypothetical protein
MIGFGLSDVGSKSVHWPLQPVGVIVPPLPLEPPPLDPPLEEELPPDPLDVWTGLTPAHPRPTNKPAVASTPVRRM